MYVQPLIMVTSGVNMLRSLTILVECKICIEISDINLALQFDLIIYIYQYANK